MLYQLSYTPVIWGDRWGSNPRMLEPQSSVLTTSPRPPYCNRQLPILPGRLQPSTFGVYVLNYCVRNGNRWDHIAIITGYTSLSFFSITLSFRHSARSMYLLSTSPSLHSSFLVLKKKSFAIFMKIHLHVPSTLHRNNFILVISALS